MLPLTKRLHDDYVRTIFALSKLGVKYSKYYSSWLCILLAGASHLKWNSLNNNLLATTHDGDLRIWDLRVSLFTSTEGYAIY